MEKKPYLKRSTTMTLRLWPEQKQAWRELAKIKGYVDRQGNIRATEMMKDILFNSPEWQNYQESLKN